MPIVEADPLALTRSMYAQKYQVHMVHICYPYRQLPDDGPTYEEAMGAMLRISRELLLPGGELILRTGPHTLHLVLDLLRGAWTAPEHYVTTYPSQATDQSPWLVSNHEHILVAQSRNGFVDHNYGPRDSVVPNWMTLIGQRVKLGESIVVEPTGNSLSWLDGQVKFYLGSK